ncbi:MAG: class I SAM-dependent DNA methyltransferase [Actinomycetota bacterium]
MVPLSERHGLDGINNSTSDIGVHTRVEEAVKGFEPSSYGDSFADVYDSWYGDVSDVARTVSTLRELGGDGPFLELGVGTGRLALELAETGARVTGIDSSRAMLDKLRANVLARGSEKGHPIDIIHGDMVEDLPSRTFPVVFIAYNTFFSLGSIEAQRRLFAEVAKRLTPGDLFVIEAAIPDVERPAGDTVRVRSLDVDRVVLSIDVHDPTSQIVEGQFVEITEAQGVRLRPWRIRYCTVDEIDSMAAAAGFVVRHRWENMHRDPFAADSASHVSVYSLRGT